MREIDSQKHQTTIAALEQSVTNHFFTHNHNPSTSSTPTLTPILRLFSPSVMVVIQNLQLFTFITSFLKRYYYPLGYPYLVNPPSIA